MAGHQGTSQNHGSDTPPSEVKSVSRREQEERTSPHYISPTVEPIDESAEENSHDEEDTVFESELECDDAQARHDGVAGDKILLRSDSKVGRANVAGIPEELLGEIRKMIQQEFGLVNVSNADKQAFDGTQDAGSRRGYATVPAAQLTCKSGSGEDAVSFKTQSRALSISPKQLHLGPFTNSVASDTLANLSNEAPTSPSRQVVVRFAEGPATSAIDGKWGSLFDSKGLPTSRLNQILGGLARYMIDEFMPQKSIVIPPEKMAAFYSLYKLEHEAYSWVSIFKCRSKGWNAAIEDMYRDLGCEYHLTQKDSTSRASIPALTATGLAKWMTINILAYPDAEANRLNHVFSELPINADGPASGLLPKQLPRHLLPDEHDSKKRRLLNVVMRDFVREFLPSSSRRDSTAQHRAIPPKADILLIDKRHSNSGSHGSSHRGKRYPLSRTESTPAPRTSTLSDVNEWDHSSYKSTRDGHAIHRDSNGLACRALPPPLRPIGRQGRANSDYTATQQQGPIVTQTYNSHKDHPATSPSTLSSPAIDSRPALCLRRLSSPVQSQSYRASSSLSPTRGDRQDREPARYHQYTPTTTADDHTPRTFPTLHGVVSERSAVPRSNEFNVGGGNPGPTWDDYLTDRQGPSARRDVLGRSARGSV